MVRHRKDPGPDGTLLIVGGLIAAVLWAVIIMSPIWAGLYFRAPVMGTAL